MNPKKIILIIWALFLVQSCTKEVDFDQIDDANIYTTYITTLVHFNFTTINFLDTNFDEILETSDSFEVKITEGSQKYLERVEFNFVIENTFDRKFTIEILFFDAMGNPINILQQPEIIVDAKPLEKNWTKVISENNIDKIFDIRKIAFKVRLLPSADNSVILSSDTSTLNLKSYAELFYNYRNI